MSYLRPEHSGIYIKIAYSLMKIGAAGAVRYITLYGAAATDDLYTMAREHSFHMGYEINILLLIDKDTQSHYKDLSTMQHALYEECQKQLRALEKEYSIVFNVVIYEADESHRELILDLLGDNYKVIWTEHNLNNFIIKYDSKFKFPKATRDTPYYLRGKPLTPMQLFDAICHTECTFVGYLLKHFTDNDPEDLYWYYYSDTTYTSCFEKGYQSWLHADGSIGLNDTLDMNLSVNEIIDMFAEIATLCPYLEFIVGFTAYNSEANEEQDTPVLDWGIWIHNSVIEVLNKERTQEIYDKYDSYYINRDTNFKIIEGEEPICDFEYFKQCLEYLDLDNDSMLSKYSWDDDKGLVKRR